jgi:hypothetical protein
MGGIFDVIVDNKESTLDLMFELIIILNNPSPTGFDPPHLLPNIEICKHAIEISKELASLNCFERACALIKK